MTRVWLFAFLCVACSSSETSRRPLPRPSETKPVESAAAMPPAGGLPRTIPADPRYYAPAGAPDPLSCRDDKDCISDTIVDTQNGCCVQQSDPMPQTWAWHAWIAEHRMAGDCHKTDCKPVAVPDKLPKACLLEAQCANGRCDNTCGGSSAGSPDAGAR